MPTYYDGPMGIFTGLDCAPASAPKSTMTYDDMERLLRYLERKGFLAGSLTADVVLPVIKQEDEQDLIPELRS